ncbi:malonyl CoA-acyl carrier protein transacylase [Corynebacterium glutamicum]|uniref:ACP S-malonyltransferase n=1 Tax=Corynebacterium glutamicum TaxID=1718 RepID=UPI00097B823E|nr:acyltransferase domain-containing protein [Corynebacterium glutamicum]GAV96041.1 malonyl CoA-acyl carrier protein transacylase [Corynebacterium glutamicum]
MVLTLLFGGQGSQKIGMLHSWLALEKVKECVTIASDVLGEDALLLDREESLANTRGVQLALLILQSGMALELQQRGLVPQFGAGHSLGAWSAAVAAGSLNFEDAVRLVDIRARTMHDAAPGDYGMSAVIGLNRVALSKAVDSLRAEGEEIWLSNLNSAEQSTVSGSHAALAKMEAIGASLGARKIKRLKVAVPAHSELMSPARFAVAKAMEHTTVDSPRYPLLANSSSRMIRTGAQVKKDLIEVIDQPVQWGPGIASLAERGVTDWIQVSPGNTLIGLLRGLDTDYTGWCVDNVGVEETIAKVGVEKL